MGVLKGEMVIRRFYKKCAEFLLIHRVGSGY